jgi:hypothetical protein
MPALDESPATSVSSPVSSRYLVTMRMGGSYRLERTPTVTPDLMRLESGRQIAVTRYVRWLVLSLTVAVIAVVAAVAVEITAITTSGNDSAPQPTLPAGQVSTSAPSTTTPSTAMPTTIAPVSRPSAVPSASPPIRPSQPAPALLRNGAQQGRAQIPWSQVGRGWYLAAPRNATSYASEGLYLVNPIGGRYLITDHLPTARDGIAEWSPDGTRAMLSRQETSGHMIFTELELATGRVLHSFDAGEWASFVGYTRPQGHAILMFEFNGKTSSLHRFGTDGSHQLAYPKTLPGFGEVLESASLYTSDGAELLVGGKHGLALLGNGGHPIRVLPAPPGAQDCHPVKWWDSSTVLEYCEVGLNPRFALFFQDVAGGRPTKLADGNPAAHPFGFVSAWKYSGGMVLREGSGCGPGELDVLRNGIISRLRLPAGVVTPTPLYGVDGDAITVRQRSTCGPNPYPGAVISVNLVTGATITLWHGAASLIGYPWQ